MGGREGVEKSRGRQTTEGEGWKYILVNRSREETGKEWRILVVKQDTIN